MATNRKGGPDDDIEARRDKVVALYNEGLGLTQISAQTGFPRGSLYYILKQRGITPARYQRADSQMSADDLRAANRALERENTRLRNEVTKFKTLVVYLETFLQANGKPTSPARPRRTSSTSG